MKFVNKYVIIENLKFIIIDTQNKQKVEKATLNKLRMDARQANLIKGQQSQTVQIFKQSYDILIPLMSIQSAIRNNQTHSAIRCNQKHSANLFQNSIQSQSPQHNHQSVQSSKANIEKPAKNFERHQKQIKKLISSLISKEKSDEVDTKFQIKIHRLEAIESSKNQKHFAVQILEKLNCMQTNEQCAQIQQTGIPDIPHFMEILAIEQENQLLKRRVQILENLVKSFSCICEQSAKLKSNAHKNENQFLKRINHSQSQQPSQNIQSLIKKAKKYQSVKEQNKKLKKLLQIQLDNTEKIREETQRTMKILRSEFNSLVQELNSKDKNISEQLKSGLWANLEQISAQDTDPVARHSSTGKNSASSPNAVNNLQKKKAQKSQNLKDSQQNPKKNNSHLVY